MEQEASIPSVILIRWWIISFLSGIKHWLCAGKCGKNNEGAQIEFFWYIIILSTDPLLAHKGTLHCSYCQVVQKKKFNAKNHDLDKKQCSKQTPKNSHIISFRLRNDPSMGVISEQHKKAQAHIFKWHYIYIAFIWRIDFKQFSLYNNFTHKNFYLNKYFVKSISVYSD